MKINKFLILSVVSLGIRATGFSQCEINASANPSQIYCGQSSTLTAFGIGAGTVVLSENFNSGFGPGWSGTPGATSFSNPCSPGGVDGTPHAWMDNNTSVPRTLTSAPFNLSTATAGVTICFDLLFSTQGNAAPCEGPDEPDEGVYFQYSTNGGTTWTTIQYFDPDGGYNTPYTSWNNWCFQIPAAAITSSTMFRWHQTADSGAQYDHWGIDNVQIVQNDVNAEVVWGNPGDDYYHTYGVGSSGGINPNAVSPTQTTTYSVTITTGTGEECTANITVVVLDPVYEVDVTASPATVCIGDCADITGTAIQVIDPGGIETYANNQLENVSGAGVGSIGASVNVNVQGINVNALTPGMITQVCINQFNYFSFGFPSSVTVADFEFKLVAPGGCGEIILIPQGTLQPSTQTGGMQNVCFVMGGATNIGSVSQPYSGTYNPNQPFDNLAGCDPNGVWSIEIEAPAGITFGAGVFSGWSITFDDPPIHNPVTASWSPTNGLSDPNSVNTQACPSNSTNYELTISNGVPGCATHTETVAITVDACGGCIPPAITVGPLSVCAPGTVTLSDAINPSSEAATFTYHASQADAQNDANPISTTVSTPGTYWVRAEDPNDPDCFAIHQITVTVNAQADASFTFADFCAGSTHSPTNIATPGGVFSFSPAPGDGATINPSTGVITNGTGGATYSVEYTAGAGNCAGTHTVSVSVFALPTPSISGDLSYCNTSGVTLDAGAGYASYSWSTGESTQTITATAQTGLTVTVTTTEGCSATSPAVTITAGNISLQVVNSTAPDCNQANGSIEVSASGGDGNYLYSINGGTPGASNVFANLPAGNHTIEVVDGSGICSNTLSVNLATTSGPSFTSLHSTDVTCFGMNDGTVTVQATGTAPLTYTVTDGGHLVATNTTGIFTGLEPGNYVVEVTDPSGCAYTQAVIITEPTELSLAYTSTDESCNGTCNGSISWQTQGGVAPLTVTLNGTVNTNGSESSLCPGAYTLVVTDANGCSVTETITISSGSQINIDAIDVTHNGCSGECTGSIVATSATGVSYALNGTTNANGIFTDLCAGVYQLTVTNTDGCVSTASVSIHSQESPVADFGFNPVDPTIFESEVDLNNYSSNATSYYWEISDMTTGYFYSTSESSFTHEFLPDTARYEVCLYATNDYGCSDTLCKELVVLDDIMIYIPNTFTPDGDEFNQTLRIYANGIDRFDFEFQLFNRWGELIFESHDYSVGWDGTHNGKAVQSGTYTWKMSVKQPHKDFRKTYTGHVNVLR